MRKAIAGLRSGLWLITLAGSVLLAVYPLNACSSVPEVPNPQIPKPTPTQPPYPPPYPPPASPFLPTRPPAITPTPIPLCTFGSAATP